MTECNVTGVEAERFVKVGAGITRDREQKRLRIPLDLNTQYCMGNGMKRVEKSELRWAKIDEEEDMERTAGGEWVGLLVKTDPYFLSNALVPRTGMP